MTTEPQNGKVAFVTEAEFRRIALDMPEAIEKSHVGHPDFRVKSGKIFATLGYPDESFAVLILTVDQQGKLVGRYPDIFEPVKGKWGKRGSTKVLLKAAGSDVIEAAMKLAWQNAAPKRKILIRRSVR